MLSRHCPESSASCKIMLVSLLSIDFLTCSDLSYQQILTRLISHFDSRSKDRLCLIFSWIAFAQRPLRKVELRSALAFSTGQIDDVELIPDYVFELCKPFIEQHPDTTYAFIHSSIKE